MKPVVMSELGKKIREVLEKDKKNCQRQHGAFPFDSQELLLEHVLALADHLMVLAHSCMACNYLLYAL